MFVTLLYRLHATDAACSGSRFLGRWIQQLRERRLRPSTLISRPTDQNMTLCLSLRARYIKTPLYQHTLLHSRLELLLVYSTRAAEYVLNPQLTLAGYAHTHFRASRTSPLRQTSSRYSFPDVQSPSVAHLRLHRRSLE